MAHIGTAVIWIMMAFVLIGALGAIKDDTVGIGKEFKEGIHSIGPIFLPVAGIMASIPYLSMFVEAITGRVFAAMGADSSMAAGALIAGDMGGYNLAHSIASTPDAFVMAAATSFMSGATIVFSIPVGLAMLERQHHQQMALGIMSGVLAIPVGVFVTIALLKLTSTPVRTEISTHADSVHVFSMGWLQIFSNLMPIVIFVVVLAALIRFATSLIIRTFLIFGKVMDAMLKLILALVVIEYFTQIPSTLWNGWGFNPVIADQKDQFRALEIAGYIGIMLAGAFPLVYVLRRALSGPFERLGRSFNISGEGMAAILAGSANILALFRLIPRMPKRDQVLIIAFSVCAAFTFGDHLAFMANFQPNMVVPLVIGKLAGGIVAMLLAVWLALPHVEKDK
ncbi:MAG: ethanolamine utilization protein EutH [Lautropia sp.]|nr:ethanolamine utilization protein EutH [Lautropia sp.]